MKATKILLLRVALGFLLVLAAHGEEDTPKAVVVFKGIARCKSNSSRIISNAPLVMVIGNATIPGAGRTTSMGHIVMAVNLTSTEQVASLLASNDDGSQSKAFLVAPPHACGAPSIPPGMELAAAVHVHPRSTTTSISSIDAVVEKFACVIFGGLLGFNPFP